MLLGSLSHPFSATTVIVLAASGLIYFTYKRWKLYQSRKAFKIEHGCLPAKSVYPVKDPIIGFDFALSMIKAARQKRLMQFFCDQFQTYGHTYSVNTLRGTMIHTTEAENIKAAFAVRFDDWSGAPARQSFKKLLGNATFMVDGPDWTHSRAFLRPTFAKDHVAGLDMFEEHLQSLLKLLPKDGSTVDLAEMFNHLTFDISTEFLFGEAIGSLVGQTDPLKQLAQDIEVSVSDCIDRVRYQILYPLFGRKDALEAVGNVHLAADKYVQAALTRVAQEEKPGSARSDEKKRYSFLDELAKETQDPQRMRYEAVSMLFAGRDTSASLLVNLWFLLSRHPEVWKRLLAEVDGLQGQRPSYEWLKNARYLKHCGQEAMRLYPVTPLLPPRVANKDTVLPLGGGPDGKSPLFVSKGSRIGPNIYAAHRNQETWGEDASEFNPDRWEGLRPGWNYTPFSGGPRICLGQQFALTEVYYVTVRLMQHYRRIEARDTRPFTEKVSVTLTSANGCLVGLSL